MHVGILMPDETFPRLYAINCQERHFGPDELDQECEMLNVLGIGVVRMVCLPMQISNRKF